MQTLRLIVSARFGQGAGSGRTPRHRDLKYSRDRAFLDFPSEVASISTPKGGIRALTISGFKH